MDILVKFIGDKNNSSLRCDAAEAILLLDSNAVGLVLPLVQDHVSAVRWHICGLLHDFGDYRATDSLLKVLQEDESGDNRCMAAWALEAVGDTSALSVLEKVVAFDRGTDREGRRVCDAALDAIYGIESRLV